MVFGHFKFDAFRGGWRILFFLRDGMYGGSARALPVYELTNFKKTMDRSGSPLSEGQLADAEAGRPIRGTAQTKARVHFGRKLRNLLRLTCRRSPQKTRGPALQAAVDYQRRVVFIKWLGSHREYDRIDVRKVAYGLCVKSRGSGERRREHPREIVWKCGRLSWRPTSANVFRSILRIQSMPSGSVWNNKGSISTRSLESSEAAFESTRFYGVNGASRWR